MPTAIVLALAAAHSTVYAQEELEEVMITDSRIRNTRAMQTPNPVTVDTLDQINVSSPTTMIEGPGRIAPDGSNTTANTGNFFTTSGAGSLNLRGLQGKRTLSLLNGRSVVSSTLYGWPDINMFPAASAWVIMFTRQGLTVEPCATM